MRASSAGSSAIAERPRRAVRSGDPFDTSALVAEAAERQYLAGLLDLCDQDVGQARELVGLVRGEMFAGDGTGAVYGAVRRSFETLEQPTRADVLTALRRDADRSGVAWQDDPLRQLFLELVDDPLLSRWHSARLATDAAVEVAELYRRRRSIELAAVLVARLREGESTSDGVAAIVEEIQATRADGPRRGVVTFSEAVAEWARHEQVPTVRTLLEPFDMATEGGLPVGGLTTLVAPPQSGKSALAVQFAIGGLLADPELRVVYALGEMTPQALARRAACVGAGLLGLPAVTMHQAGSRSSQSRETLEELVRLIGERMSIVQPPLTVARVDEQVQRTGARLVVIDYLQLVESDGESRVEQLDGIVGQLRELAIRREAAVLVISSMAKATGAGSRIGQFARGTGEADYASELLYLGVPDEHEDERGVRGVRWECRKARNLPQVDVVLRFDGACQTFSGGVPVFPEFPPFEPGGRL